MSGARVKWTGSKPGSASIWAQANAAPPLRPDKAAETFDHGTPPGFEERVNRLAGDSTYRMPVEGRETKEKPLPMANITAAALSYARKERGNFGPDVAVAVALHSDAKRDECVHALSMQLMERSTARDARPFMYASICAWDWLVHGKVHKAPTKMPEPAWQALLNLAIAVMDNERLAAIRSARRAA